MANTSRINGFKPVKHLTGAPYNGQFNIYEVIAADATAVFVGDLVQLVAGTTTEGYPSVGVVATTQLTTGSGVVGAVVGFVVDPTALNTPQYRAASTKRLVKVADAPDLVFEVQDGGTVPCTAALIGANTGYTIGSGSTTTGTSAATTGATVPATTVTLPLKILGVVQRPDNEAYAASQKLLVKINVHAYGSMGTNVS